MNKIKFKVTFPISIYPYLSLLSLGQYFDNLSLNAASCQTSDSTDYVCISMEPELKDLKIVSS